jgi:hypothetical protein
MTAKLHNVGDHKYKDIKKHLLSLPERLQEPLSVSFYLIDKITVALRALHYEVYKNLRAAFLDKVLTYGNDTTLEQIETLVADTLKTVLESEEISDNERKTIVQVTIFIMENIGKIIGADTIPDFTKIVGETAAPVAK